MQGGHVGRYASGIISTKTRQVTLDDRLQTRVVLVRGVNIQLCQIFASGIIAPWAWPLESLAGSTRYIPVSLSGVDLKRLNQVTYASGYLGHSGGAARWMPSHSTATGSRKSTFSLATLQPEGFTSDTDSSRHQKQTLDSCSLSIIRVKYHHSVEAWYEHFC